MYKRVIFLLLMIGLLVLLNACEPGIPTKPPPTQTEAAPTATNVPPTATYTNIPPISTPTNTATTPQRMLQVTKLLTMV